MMNFLTSEKAALIFTALYTTVFSAYFIVNLNIEFLGYIGVIVLVFALLYGTLYETRIPASVLWGISVCGLLHMLGGSVPVDGDILYTWRMVPLFDGGGEFYIFKYDQFVHVYLYAVVALLFLHLLRNYLGQKQPPLLIGFIALMAAQGVGAVNEMIEFIVVLLVPDNGVGGYYNTLLDIVFNFIGATLAITGFYLFHVNAEK